MRSVFSRLIIGTLALVLVPGTPTSAREQQEEDEAKKDSREKGLQLKPSRKIEFSTTEGTWLSLDVAPDGQSLVFEMLGDLYTLPIAGGQARRLTEGMAYDSQPRFSPDGKWIAFVSDRDGADNLWIIQADGTNPRKLSKEKSVALISPAWMPDSRYVLISKGGRRGLSIWMYHLEGGSGLEVTTRKETAPSGNDRPPSRSQRLTHLGAAVSPDGRFLYFARQNSGSVYNQMSFGWRIYRRDLNTGDTDLVTQGLGGGMRPLISPDGSKLVYGSRLEADTGLRIRDLNSGRDRWLRYPVQRDDMESRGTRDLLPSYAFTPDGNDLIVTYEGKFHRVNLESGAATEIPFQADVALEAGPLLNFQRRVEEGPVRSRLIIDPVQSPDGKQIAFSSMAHIYVMDLQEKQPRRLTSADAAEFKPTWSPDGGTIAYVTWAHSGQGHIWRAPVDGSTPPQRLTTIPAFYTDPVFSPEGDRIVARRGNAWMRSQTPSEFGGLRIRLDLIWLPASGGEVQLIVPARGLAGPHFTNQGDRIFFYSREGLVSLRYDGTDRKTHLQIKGKRNPRSPEAPPARSAQISPDGHWALAQTGNQVFVVAVPPLVGSSPSVNIASASVPVSRLTDVGADSYGWADNGKTITWSVGSTFFRRPLDSISFKPEKKERPQSEESSSDEESASESEDPEKDPAAKAREEHEATESFEVVLEFPRYQPQGTILLKGATLITMKGDEVIKKGDILVTDNRISAIGRNLPRPAGTRVFDMKGKFILPGFVDTHAHYEMRTEGVLELHNWSFLANLAYGVTSGLDVQTSTNDYLAYLDLVQAGRMTGPRAYSTGPGVFSNNNFQSSSAAKHVLKKYKKYYRNHNLKSYMVGNRQQRQWVAKAAQELELTVTTEGGLDLKLDLTHAIDGFGGNEHSLPIVPLFSDVVELFARSKTAYTPTLLVLYGGPWAENYFFQTTEVHDDPKLNRFVPHNELDRITKRRPWFREDEHAFPKIAAQAAKIQRAGGLVGVGGHGQLQGLGVHWEMWALSLGGMTPREVLKAATIDGAHIIGLGGDLGSLEVGKLADLVVLERNPLDNIHYTNTIRYVMKNGELFEGDSLDRLWPQKKEIPPFWWWETSEALEAALDH